MAPPSCSGAVSATGGGSADWCLTRRSPPTMATLSFTSITRLGETTATIHPLRRASTNSEYEDSPGPAILHDGHLPRVPILGEQVMIPVEFDITGKSPSLPGLDAASARGLPRCSPR